MDTVASKSPRRSGRAFLKMKLQAQGRAHNGRKFRETCETVVVNAHGALILLKHEIDDGEMLVLTHPETMEEQECRVVYLGEPADRQRVGVEFLTPAPRFWGTGSAWEWSFLRPRRAFGGWTSPRMLRKPANRTEQ